MIKTHCKKFSKNTPKFKYATEIIIRRINMFIVCKIILKIKIYDNLFMEEVVIL